MAYETFAMDANGRAENKPQLWSLTQTKGDSYGQGDRAGNSVKYITPAFAGFTGHELAGLGESSSLGYQSLAVKYQDEKTKAALIRDSTSNVIGSFFTPGTNFSDGVAGDGGTAGSSLAWGGTISTKVMRNVAAASYDLGAATVNYIYAKAFTETKAGSLTTNTVGIKVPVDQITFALSYGVGTLDSYHSSGTYARDAKLTDTTLGAFYALDKSTSAYFLGSVTNIGTQTVQADSVKTANLGFHYKF